MSTLPPMPDSTPVLSPHEMVRIIKVVADTALRRDNQGEYPDAIIGTLLQLGYDRSYLAYCDMREVIDRIDAKWPLAMFRAASRALNTVRDKNVEHVCKLHELFTYRLKEAGYVTDLIVKDRSPKGADQWAVKRDGVTYVHDRNNHRYFPSEHDLVVFKPNEAREISRNVQVATFHPVDAGLERTQSGKKPVPVTYPFGGDVQEEVEAHRRKSKVRGKRPPRVPTTMEAIPSNDRTNMPMDGIEVPSSVAIIDIGGGTFPISQFLCPDGDRTRLPQVKLGGGFSKAMADILKAYPIRHKLP
jgi:hypothetical protein